MRCRSAAMSEDPKCVVDILDRLNETAREHQNVSIGNMVEAFGHRSYGPFLIVPALVELTPIGGIPGVPTFLAAIILLFAIQMVFGRHHFWMPGFLSSRSVSAKRLKQADDKLLPIARWLDRWFHGRLPRLTKGPFVRAAAVICVLLTLTVPPLELVPFASSGPMLAIAMFGLALLVRDGLLMIVATVIAIGAFGFGLWLWG